MIRPHLIAWIAVALLTAPGSAFAEAEAPPNGLAEAEACAQRNLPHQTLELRATFTKVDRLGGERASRAKVIGKKLEDGLHRIVLRFDRPLDVRGTAMLMIEGASGPADFYVFSPDDRKVRRVSGRNPNGLFGTDFSYDDFENWRGFAKRGKAERLPDAVESDRPVYVMAGTPAPEDGSSYERVVTYVDRETCVILRIDSFEPGAKLRKVLHADPTSVKKTGEYWFATAIELKDVIDETSTKVAIDSIRLDVELPDRMFRQSDLSSN